ncbi:hypothetical protein FA95DRAFT_561129 [Auriscalpium vulgare]|uniref:Uncharacterized protein n=1 Tax=Auriscalpium vulgare TaxID=40419 RepID=A0ACB8RF54_9AGAM|nr:hypothetical protein FA95DRAFT_561129 [Auriscalpium vulgare]
MAASNIALNLQGVDFLYERNAAQLDAAQHNSQLPATRLPPEILSHIFSILSSIHKPHTKDGSGPRSLGWLAATHVCQRWRTIALEDASLWASNITVPFVLGAQWAETFLSRARNASLSITRPQHNSHSLPFLTHTELVFLTANLARTQVLCLNTGDAHLRALCTPAPLLHTLHILDPIYIWVVSNPPFTLLDGLLGGATGAPALRHLRVETKAQLPWTSPLLAGLKSLNVEESGRNITGAEAGEMFTALGSMHALEQLALQLRLGAPETAPQPIVALPALRTLTLKTPVASARHILARVTLPATASVRCEMGHFGGEWADLPAVFSAVAACIDVQATSVVCLEMMPDVHRMTCAADSLLVHVNACRGYTPRALSVSFSAAALPARSLVTVALAALVSTRLAQLNVSSDGSDDAWPEALRCAHALRNLSVARRAGQQFCAALAAAPAGFLPALAQLWIRGIDFLSGGVRGYVQVLAQSLERRARAGCALSAVGFSECKLDDAQVHMLKEAVPGMHVMYSHES